MSTFLSSALCAMAAILLHGLGHFCVAYTVGLRALRVRRTPSGFRLVSNRPFPTYDTELFCALGGPLFNALSALLCRGLLAFGIGSTVLPSLIALSLYLALLNLLPLQGFDGERILRCLLLSRRRLFPSLSPDAIERLLSLLSMGILTLLWLLSVYVLLRRGSALSLYIFCLQLFLGTQEDQDKN